LGYLANKGNHLIDGEGSMTFNQLPPSYFALGNQLLPQNLVDNPFYGIIDNPASPLSQPRVSYAQLLRPFPHYTAVNAFRKPQGNSIYHGFTLGVTKRYSQGLNLQLSYTASKLIDDVSQTVTFLGPAGSKQDFYCRSCERAISTQDRPQRLVVSANYELPFGRGRRFMTSAPRAVDLLFGGWQVNGIYTIQSNVPLQISNGGNFTRLFSPGQRPHNNGTSAQMSGPIESRLDNYFDQSVFRQAGNFEFGSVSRTMPDLRGPRDNNLDASLFKRFHITERFMTEFRAESFNAFNHPIWNSPGVNIQAPATFGRVLQKGNERRIMQLALRIEF
jgi:hypothetical protein